VGTWDVPVNSDFSAIDGYFGGVQTISVNSSTITLTAPGGSSTPSGGPTQAQNAVLRFTGALTSNQFVVLPMPGYYIVENLATGNPGFVLAFKSLTGGGRQICVDYGETIHIYNDGVNVKFVNFGRIGHIEMWAGLSAMPSWVNACSLPPYLLCDGGTYNFSDFPYLGQRLGATFGGNGVTTFSVPDLRGRVALPYDSTGARITAPICGINGQVLGSAIDNQGIVLNAGQIPTITAAGSNNIVVRSQNGLTGIPTTTSGANVAGGAGAFGSGGPYSANSTSASWAGVDQLSGSNVVNVTSNNTGGQSHSNVQPSQVTGIAVIRAG